MLLNETEKEILEDSDEARIEDKLALLLTECGTHDPGTEESKRLMLLRYSNSMNKKLVTQKREEKTEDGIWEDIHASRWAAKGLNDSMWAIKNKPISFRQSEILRQKHEQKE